MIRKAVIALGLCLGIIFTASPDARAAPAVATGVAAALPAPTVETARYYRVYYVRRRYYRRRYYRPRYYRRSYYGYGYHRPYYRRGLWPFF